MPKHKTPNELFREKLERRLIEFRKLNPSASFEATKKEAIEFTIEEHEKRQAESARARKAREAKELETDPLKRDPSIRGRIR